MAIQMRFWYVKQADKIRVPSYQGAIVTAFLPRMLYLLAVSAGILLIWPNPVTIFLAGCFSCLTIPLYRRFCRKGAQWKQEITRKLSDGRLARILTGMADSFPLMAYSTFIVFSFFTPFAALILLVSPQAVAGLARLRELRASNFQLPPHWLEYIHKFQAYLSEYPTIEKTVYDTLNNLDSMFSNMVSILVSRSFGFVGSTFNVLWLVFLFLVLTILFSQYSRAIRNIVGRILQLPHSMMSRFILAIHMALRGIMLGIVLVAIVQGILCGIGFAVAGVNQPAFWGLLATMVAPIPMVGTALVWLPLCVSLWFTGKTVAAIGLALWGALFVAGVDNVLRPFFLRQGIKAPFFVLILVILCGLNSFGAVGLITGPILLAIAMQALEEGAYYYKRR